jgi:hypothetical protein
MITVEQAREKYPTEYQDLTDEQLQDVINFFYKVCYACIDHFMEEKQSNKDQWSSKEQHQKIEKDRE